MFAPARASVVTARGPDALDAMIRMLVRSRAGGADRASSRPRPAGQGWPGPGSRQPTRPPQEISLPRPHSHLAQDAELVGGFDAFGEERRSNAGGESGQRFDEGSSGLVRLDLADERDVQFDHVRPEVQHVTQARESRTRVVDGQPDASFPQRIERSPEDVVVGDRSVLGDLQDDPFGRHVLEQFTQIGRATRLGRDVDAHHDRSVEPVQPAEGPTQCGDLQLDPQPDLGRLREPDIRRSERSHLEAA